MGDTITETPNQVRTQIHLCLSVRGAIQNRDYDWFTKNDGSKPTQREALDFLLHHLAQGHEVIPIGECDDFDWKTGCRGHRVGGGV